MSLNHNYFFPERVQNFFQVKKKHLNLPFVTDCVPGSTSSRAHVPETFIKQTKMCLCCNKIPSDYNIPEVGPRSRTFFRCFCYWCCFFSVLCLTYRWFRPLMIIWLIEDKSLHYKPRGDICASSETDSFLESASVKGLHRAPTQCVCNRLLFSGKCTGFTICFTCNDISLSKYINQC